MGKATPKKTEVLPMRFPSTTIARADKLVASLEKSTGERPSRAAVLRMAALRGLHLMEQEKSRHPAPPR